MIADLRYLLSTFPGHERRMLALNVLAQFAVATMDLLGIAAILPLMQVVMGSPMDQGTLGSIHRLLGDPTKEHFVLALGALMICSFLIKAVLASFLTWWGLGNLARVQTLTARRLLDGFLHEDLLTHRRRNVAEITRTVGASTTDACARVLGGLINTASALMSIVLIITLLVVVAPLPTVLAIGYFGVVVFVLQRRLAPANIRAGAEAQHTALITAHALIDSTYAFREARMHNARDFFLDRFHRANVLNADASRRANFLSTLPKYVLELVTMVGLTLFITIGVLTGSNQDTMPTLSLFVAATVKMLPLLVQLTTTVGTVRVGRAGLGFTVEALRAEQRPQQSAEQSIQPEAPVGSVPRKALPAQVADIALQDIGFAYPGAAREVLSGITLDIPAGRSVAVCGPSGAGKTTLIDIMLGLIQPTSGIVTFGGAPVDSDPARWHETVAYVPQDVYLLDETLAGNVAFGVDPSDYDRDKIIRCLRRAALGDLLDELPEGMDTRVGDRGSRLSGGQRQRVGIARALYREPSVVVLDEATSALDNETEHKIATTIGSLRGSITTVVVAHRLSTVRDVDTLAFLDHGRLEAVGTFDQVVRQSPTFARLVALGRLEDPPVTSDDG